MGGVESECSPEIRIRLSIPLQPTEDGSPEDQEFGLVRRAAQSFREDIHCLTGLLEVVQKPGEMQASLHVKRL
jgi:hypothetical protein